MTKYLLALCGAVAEAQSLGGAGTLRGTVRDTSGGPVPSAAIEMSNSFGAFSRQTISGPEGDFAFNGLPPGVYRLRAAMAGFETHASEVAIRSAVPIEIAIRLEIAGQQTSVTVQAAHENLVENQPVSGDTVDRQLLAALPTLSPDSGLNDAIIYTTAGVAADSNGFFHPLGDHAQVSYVIDGQPVSDQRNKVFSTSIPANAIQSMEVISGLPPAEYGDKTSLVINATTRSGLGQKPSGSFHANYGSFGTIGQETTIGMGGARWGNFLAFNAERSGRFLDTPEFWPMHDSGNTGTFFDRIDFQPSGRDAFHLNLLAARNWMQVPNTYDQARQDQRQKVVSFNIAPGYQRVLDTHTLASLNLFVRRDDVHYYPSRNPADDFPATLAQHRSLMHYGAHADLAQSRGRHNWKTGVNATQTRLDEDFRIGIPAALQFHFQGRANINQFAAFAQDSIALGPVTFNLGMRFDNYHGLTRGIGIQPRGAFSYLFKPTNTVIRGGFSRTMETPTNENLVASSSTGQGGLAGQIFQGTAVQEPIALGRRNQYDAGLQQSLGRWILIDVSYFRKYTRNAFDFDALFSTPITFPIGWKQSKLDGVSARISTVEFKGFRAYATMGHANARFFGPENGGIVFNSNLSVGAYRQDHDQVYQQNVNIHYQRGRDGWWADWMWRYDSGLVVGAVNGLDDALALTADQQSTIGFYCGADRATLLHRVGTCASPDYGAERIRILAPGAENPDRDPPRTKSRHLLDVSAGTENLFHTERLRTVVRFTVLNLTNVAALYNFLSPFSGTHWVGPRTYQAQLGWAW